MEKHQITVIAMEMTTVTKYTLPTFSFGVLTGMVAALDRPVIEVLPHVVKRAATGNARSTKQDIIAWALGKT